MLRRSMRSMVLIGLLFLLAAGALAAASSADEPAERTSPALPGSGPAADAAARMQEFFAQAAAITSDRTHSPEAKRARLEQLIDPLLDNAMLAEVALGPLAPRFERGEYAEFSHEYARFVTDALVRRFAAFPNQQGRVEGARWDAEREIASVVGRGAAQPPGTPSERLAQPEPVRIGLSLRRRLGEWRLVGFERGGVDVARSFREQFASVLVREEPAALIEELRARNQKNDSDNPFAKGA